MAAAAFSTPESNCLEKTTDTDEESYSFELTWTQRNRDICIDWIQKNNYQKTCLQFPDSYLQHSTKISDDLKTSTISSISILGDTSYGSCCVDEIAAAHVDADSIIHFGNACQSKVARLPVLYIYPQLPFEIADFCNNLKTIQFNNEQLIIYFGLEYQYVCDIDDGIELKDQIKKHLPDNQKFIIKKYSIKDDNECGDEKICILIGHDNQNFFNLCMSVKASKWLLYDPPTKIIKETNPLLTNYIRRRYFYIEKCKDAQTLGLVVGTLTSDGYLDIIKHIKEMAQSHGIRTYIISVGRINPAKLANFIEIDCFVLIGCPFNNLYTSREFYKPIVSVFEAEMALNPAWHLKLPECYVTDFQEILPNGKFYNQFKIENIVQNDVSLLTGKLRNVNNSSSEKNGNVNTDGTLIERKNHELMELNNGTVFEDRSWKGLDPALGNIEPVKITKGRSGIPINYSQN